MEWTAKETQFDSRQEKGIFFFFHNTGRGSGKYPTSYSLGAGGSFCMEKKAEPLS
jgi:hypothetical protein